MVRDMSATLLCAALLFLRASSAGPSLDPELADGWTALPIPALCQPAPGLSEPQSYSGGTHIDMGDLQRAPSRFRPAPILPLIQLIELLEADARRAGTDLRCLRTAPPLLVRGSTEGIERARTMLQELDRAGRSHRLQLILELAPSEAREPENSFSQKFNLRSSESATIGRRESVEFLADFDVEVAPGGGSAYPITGSIAIGHSATVTAWRTPDGQAVFVSGSLDLSELIEILPFETGSPDLGVIEQPRVATVRVTFSGLLDAAGELRVEVRGAALQEPDWNLSIRAATSPDAPDRWRAVDLAWLESVTPAPQWPRPGAGVRLPAQYSQNRVVLEPLPSAVLWGELEASFQDRRANRPLFALAPAILIAPTEDGRVWGELDSLLEAAKSARSQTTAITVRDSSVEVRFTSAGGQHASVQAGVETTVLSSYQVELATDYWMADPVIERVFDGFAVQTRQSEKDIQATYWVAKSGELRELDREAVLHGKLGLPHRELQFGSAHVEAGSTAETGIGLSISVGSL